MANLVDNINPAVERELSTYQFDEATYGTLCQLSQNGDLGKVKDIIKSVPAEAVRRFGRLTFCPEESRQSPFVLAAQYGNLHIVQYFMNNYADIVDVNFGATIVSQNSGMKIHQSTALLAATLGGYTKVIKFLVSRGADVNKCSHTGSTPLRTASYHGHIDIMKCLIKNGADVSRPNILGESPLCIAASRNQVQAFKLLLKHGANCTQADIDNHTPMHLAAVEGHDEIITALLQFGVSPVFAVANPRDKDYVPCPLFLAAVSGHSHTVSLFTSRDDCPDACKSDAIMILAMSERFHQQSMLDLNQLKSKMELSLKIREEKRFSVIFSEPRKEFGYRQEIKTRKELQELWDTPEFLTTGLYYQWLLVVERCINGMMQSEMSNTCIEVSCCFIDTGCCYEAELLLNLMVEIELACSERELPSLQLSYPEDAYEHLANILNILMDCCVQMIASFGYQPELFDRYIYSGVRILGFISSINAAQSFVLISSEKIALQVLKFFSLWLTSITTVQEEQRAEAKALFQAVGEKFVASHLYIDQTTLLHIAATSSTTDTNILLLENLLEWGADQAINTVNSLGWTPILCSDSVDVFNLFVSYGGHPDVVNNLGESGYDELNTTGNNHLVPLPLACYAARKIVDDKIPYLSLDLPFAVQCFVKLHDKEHATQQL